MSADSGPCAESRWGSPDARGKHPSLGWARAVGLGGSDSGRSAIAVRPASPELSGRRGLGSAQCDPASSRAVATMKPTTCSVRNRHLAPPRRTGGREAQNGVPYGTGFWRMRWGGGPGFRRSGWSADERLGRVGADVGMASSALALAAVVRGLDAPGRFVCGAVLYLQQPGGAGGGLAAGVGGRAGGLVCGGGPGLAGAVAGAAIHLHV